MSNTTITIAIDILECLEAQTSVKLTIQAGTITRVQIDGPVDLVTLAEDLGERLSTRANEVMEYAHEQFRDRVESKLEPWN